MNAHRAIIEDNALLLTLSARTRNVLSGMKQDALPGERQYLDEVTLPISEFLNLNYEGLLRRPNCGRKTVNEIKEFCIEVKELLMKIDQYKHFTLSEFGAITG